MRRKIIRQGNNTLTITLPKRWAEENKIRAGEEIEVVEQHDKLIIDAGVHKEGMGSIEISVTGLDRTAIMLLVTNLYIFGYDEVTILSDSLNVPHYRIEKEVALSKVIHDTVNRFVGMEVVGSTSRSFTLKKVSKESREEFEVILRRVFRLLLEMMGVFIEGCEKNDKSVLEGIEFQHVTIRKFINYCLRLLNLFGYTDVKKTCSFFAVLEHLGTVDDAVKNAARMVLQNNFKISAKAVKAVKGVKELFQEAYTLFYDYDVKKLSPFIEEREHLRHSFQRHAKEFAKEELAVLGGIVQISELLIDVVELKMGMGG